MQRRPGVGRAPQAREWCAGVGRGWGRGWDGVEGVGGDHSRGCHMQYTFDSMSTFFRIPYANDGARGSSQAASAAGARVQPPHHVGTNAYQTRLYTTLGSASTAPPPAGGGPQGWLRAPPTACQPAAALANAMRSKWPASSHLIAFKTTAGCCTPCPTCGVDVGDHIPFIASCMKRRAAGTRKAAAQLIVRTSQSWYHS